MKKYAALIVSLLVGWGATATASSLHLRSASSPADYRIGDAVANFRLKNVNGSMVSLSDFSGQKGVIVIFTCNHCPFSKAYEDRVGALNERFATQGYPVVAINPSDPKTYEDDTFEQVRERAKTKGFSYPYLVDDTQTVTRAFGASRTPQAYVLKNTGGTFVVQYIGTLDDNPQDPASVTKRYVEDAVANLLAGKPVVVTTTKAIGCAIKWKDA
ncbi:thioredoxin family protein [Salmonirosea aquatica]|uniref:Redoxin domain-containing protein n=1 Tax=Salmonirosea aquatica TaxID=2654236 RepID=A0A7C9F5N7_9BACT|nr:redoxin domain-containing protein [Cytophagaceae bacterium SJW1-29]